MSQSSVKPLTREEFYRSIVRQDNPDGSSVLVMTAPWDVLVATIDGLFEYRERTRGKTLWADVVADDLGIS